MATYGVAWIVAGAAFFGLGTRSGSSQMAPCVYQPVIGAIMAERFNAFAAVLFYFLYVSGIIFFAVAPSRGQSPARVLRCSGRRSA